MIYELYLTPSLSLFAPNRNQLIELWLSQSIEMNNFCLIPFQPYSIHYFYSPNRNKKNGIQRSISEWIYWYNNIYTLFGKTSILRNMKKRKSFGKLSAVFVCVGKYMRTNEYCARPFDRKSSTSCVRENRKLCSSAIACTNKSSLTILIKLVFVSCHDQWPSIPNLGAQRAHTHRNHFD